MFDCFTQNIIHDNSILDSNNYMQTTWMESNCQTILLLLATYLESLCCVIPNLNSTIFGTSDNELLSDTDIQSSDLILVEVTHYWLEFNLIIAFPV